MKKAQKAQIDLAIEQLDVALELFLEGRGIVSALPLTGAAEEIFGKALHNRSNVLSFWHDQVYEVWDVPWKKYVKKTNEARQTSFSKRGDKS